MAYMEWSNDLDVKVAAMNREHQRLITLMNRLHELNDKRASKKEIRGALNSLATYTVTHFNNEEAYLEKINFKGLRSHKLIHKNLLEEMRKHIAAFEKGDGRLSEKFFGFLRRWLVSHIRGIDGKYADAAKHGAGAAAHAH